MESIQWFVLGILFTLSVFGFAYVSTRIKTQWYTWVVLIGGEYGGVMVQDAARTRPGSWLGSHTSLQAIGRAFEELLPTVARDRIIVVAQLRETLRWLDG